MRHPIGLRWQAILFVILYALTSCAARPVKAETATVERYGMKSSHDRLIDNKGEGYENLYGVRNFRAVLANTLYRGGGNNATNRHHKRPNRSPLPSQGLDNLCREGFSTAVYMYSEGFSNSPKKVNCTDRRTGKPNTLEYVQMGPYRADSIREMLTLVHQSIKEGSAGRNSPPLYYHCWNGWHASGLISAYAKRQFCGYSGEEAVRYWDLNTDGNNADPNFHKLRQQMREFVPLAGLEITPDERRRVCLPMKSAN